MQQAKITVVAGLPGVGKTTWIGLQLAKTQNCGYFSFGSDNFPTDQIFVESEFPDVVCLQNKDDLFQYVAKKKCVYIEVNFGVKLTVIDEILQGLEYQRVAVGPVENFNSDFPADQIIESSLYKKSPNLTQMSRICGTGEVIDPVSLDVFWYEELTQGAYGEIERAKAIFDLANGSCFYFDFVQGRGETDFLELNLPPWIEGRPKRFSGLEIWGNNLDHSAIAENLKNCCLSDAAIYYYQNQIKQSLNTEPVTL